MNAQCSICDDDVDCAENLGVGHVCYQDLCQQPVCADTDKGNDLIAQGTVTITYDVSDPIKYVDQCSNKAQLKEYFCNTNTMGSAVTDCPPDAPICSNGACVEDTSCSLHTDCDAGQVCQTGQCVGCTEDGDECDVLGNGYFCHANLCQQHLGACIETDDGDDLTTRGSVTVSWD